MVMVVTLSYGLIRVMKGSMSNGISKPDKESKTSMLNRLIR
jgi:hypothetical protein